MSRTLHEILEKLASPADTSAGSSSESENVPEHEGLVDPVYVEKLASAVDFLSDNVETLFTDNVITVNPSEGSLDITESLKSALMSKLASDDNKDETEIDSKALDSILLRLRGLNSEEVEDESDDTDEVLEESFSTEGSEFKDGEEGDGEEAGEIVIKAASAKLSLADMLRTALDKTDTPDESTYTAGVKTASNTGNTPGELERFITR